jgi:prepilin-type N-terminal cleavage/methylation domain-containing protein
MRRYKAFTLVEMLAVVSIMLILLGVTYGIFSALAEQSGPDAVLVTVQAAVHNARDYAAGRGVHTRLVFRFKSEGGSGDMLESSTMMLQYIPPGEPLQPGSFEDVPGRQPMALPPGLYICKGFPTGMPAPPSVASGTNITQADVERWKKYEQDLLDEVARFAMSGTDLKNEHDEFYIEFEPSGYPPASPISSRTRIVEEGGLTIVRVAGKQVLGYAFFPFNPNTGTRLVFD